MPKSSPDSPIHLSSNWCGVFENLYVDSLPIEYIELIRIEFSNGSLWEIDIHSLSKYNVNSIEHAIFELCQHPDEEILNLEFKINITKLKSDIIFQSKNLF